jgi:redox-sensitive bicupin YhaK (pirin superfamily)
MKTTIHKAETRGHANHSWLNAHHTFSFASYYDPERIHFGMLRVLNDDIIAPGKGFGTHPHDNMEIITIPLKGGGLEHKDSMGNSGIIHPNEIQVMSAGAGVQHSEFNASKTESTNLLQIWVFPNQKNVQPRYDQLKLNPEDRQDKFQQILSPNPDDEGVWIYQDAWFHMAQFSQNKEINYTLKNKENGVYLFVISGQLNIENEPLSSRDGMGIWDIDKIRMKADSESEILIMEIPMN